MFWNPGTLYKAFVNLGWKGGFGNSGLFKVNGGILGRKWCFEGRGWIPTPLEGSGS